MLARAAVFLAVSVPLAVAACGGSTPPPQAPEGAPADKPADAPAEAGKSAASPKKTLADHHRDFMEGCSAKVPNAPDYCECSWEQMTKVFSEEEMGGAVEDKGKLEQLRGRIEGVCKAKLPEGRVKESFLKSCSSDQPTLAPYCECTYGEYRKTLSVADLTDEATAKSERFTAAKKSAVKACGAKLPEAFARDGFMKGCAKDDKMKPFCDCAWKALRREGSAAEIDAGFVDFEAARPKIEKGCGKLRPAK